MNLLSSLTIKNLKANKKRSIVTIIGIMLSVALITAVSTMYVSSIATLINFETQEKGNFHAAFYNVSSDDIKTIENNKGIEELFVTQQIGYAPLNDSKNESKPYAFIKAFTKESLTNLSIKIVDGRLPENSNEIIIPTHLKTNGRVEYKIGDVLSLDVGNRFVDDEKLTQDNPYNEGEIFKSSFKKEYKIVGIMERPASNLESYSAPGYTFATIMDSIDESKTVDVYALYNKDGKKQPYKVTADILGVNPKIFDNFYKEKKEDDIEKYTNEISKAKYEYTLNTYLIMLQNNPLSDNTISGLGVVVGIVVGIIIFTSVFCIKNSFDISITEKTKQYGMLKSVGATKKQIRRNVIFEGLVLGLFGIPLGIVLGLVASSILVVVTNVLIGSSLTDGLRLILCISYKSIIISILLGLVTIILSSIRSSRRASKVSPIESIRNSADIKIKSSKIKTPKLIKKMFGIGGEISYKNLKRNRKKYRTTIISITVSVFMFIALYSFIHLTFSSVQNEVGTFNYNVVVSLEDEKILEKQNYKYVTDITKLNGVKRSSIIRTRLFDIKNCKYTNKYLEVFGKENLDNYIEMYSIGKEEYENYINKLGLKYEEIKDKAILINYNKTYEKDDKGKEKIIKVKHFDYSKGDVLINNNDDYNEQIEIGFETEELPYGLESLEPVMLIISDEYYDYITNGKTKRVEFILDVENPDNYQDEVEKYLVDYNPNIQNINEAVKMMNNFYLLIAIFLYGFIIVISLIGVTNVFNTISTSMELRKQEFAMLKSIGMTKSEFNRMIRLETIFMGTKSLVLGIPIGLILSYWIYTSLAYGSPLQYDIPFIAIIISFVLVFLLITVIMRYSMKKINNQNTIETIRNENI